MGKTKLLVVSLMALGVAAGWGCERKVVNQNPPNLAATSCFTCHTDQDDALLAAQQEWENSKHASGDNINRNRNGGSRTCEKCHTHEGFIESVTGTFPGDTTSPHFTVISCFTCHQPHTNGNFNLRKSTPVTLANGVVFDKGPANLCANCHQSRTNVTTAITDNLKLTTRFGPHHSNQGDMLRGTGGYQYAGYTYTSSAHTGSTTEGCINCHMTGTQANLVGGHSFNMVNDERGLKNLKGCNVPECHGTTGALTTLNRHSDEDFDGDGTIAGVQDELTGLLDTLGNRLLAAGLLTPVTEGGVTTLLPTNNRTVATKDSVGAVYNYLFIHEDRSEGIHNTEYAVGLLKSSINYITTGNPSGVSPRQKGSLMAAH